MALVIIVVIIIIVYYVVKKNIDIVGKDNPANADEMYELYCHYKDQADYYSKKHREEHDILIFAHKVQPNQEKASYWLDKAAKNGHAGAQYKVGCSCTSKREARKWLTKAAEQGHEDAKEKLANIDNDNYSD